MNVGIYITMNIMAVHITTDVVLCVGLSVLKTTYQFPRLPSYNKNVILSATNGMSFSKGNACEECSIDINQPFC